MRCSGEGPLSVRLWPAAIVLVPLIWMTATPSCSAPQLAVFGLILGIAITLFRSIPWPSIQSTARVLARYSYAIYLSHFPIQLYVFSYPREADFRWIPPLPLLPHYSRTFHWAIFLLLSISVPCALYHLIEQPGINLGKKFSDWITHRAISSIARTDKAAIALSADTTY